jgi:hypothetical protein
VADVGVGLHEEKEVDAGDGLDEGGDEGFGGGAVDGVCLERSEAEDIAGAGNAEEKEAAFNGGGGDFDEAAADDQEVIGGETFAEEDFMAVALAGEADGVEVAQGLIGERAKGWGTAN